MPVYEVVVISAPTKKEIEDGATERLILGPRAVMAKDNQSAVLVIAQADEMKGQDMNKLAVLVRPFA